VLIRRPIPVAPHPALAVRRAVKDLTGTAACDPSETGGNCAGDLSEGADWNSFDNRADDYRDDRRSRATHDDVRTCGQRRRSAIPCLALEPHPSVATPTLIAPRRYGNARREGRKTNQYERSNKSQSVSEAGVPLQRLRPSVPRALADAMRGRAQISPAAYVGVLYRVATGLKIAKNACLSWVARASMLAEQLSPHVVSVCSE
jgi:hypothetical protein